MEISEYYAMEKIETQHPWFVAKRNFLSIILDKYKLAPGSIRVLDVGCGTGAVMQFLKERGWEVYGVDPNSEALGYCADKGLTVKSGTAEKIDFPTGSFDIVLALDVLEHTDDDGLSVNEIKRILKPRGIFICTVPAHQFLWSYHDEYLHHQRRYSKQQLLTLLTQAGMKVKLMSYIHAGIFLPVALARWIKGVLPVKSATSDVKDINKVLTAILNFMYNLEILFFKIFNRLPFGVSLLAVTVKGED